MARLLVEQERNAWRQLLASPVPAFLVANVVLAFFHEPWRDEAQPWLVARDAPNMFAMLDSETHPALWYLLAWPLAKLGLPYESLRVAHVLVATAALAVLVLAGPFSRAEQWLYAFGYFVLYEYSVLTRNYAIFLLVLVLLAATWRARFERPLLHGALLLLLANTVGHGALLAGVLAGAYSLEWLLRAPLRGQARLLVAPALAGLGIGLAFLAVRPAPDVAEWRTQWNAAWLPWLLPWIAWAPIHAFAPIPILGDGWTWGATQGERWLADLSLLDAPLLAAHLGDAAVVFAGLALLVGSALLFVRKPTVLALYAAGALVLVLFFYLKAGVSSQTRHHGLLFLWWIFCLWIARDASPSGGRLARGAVLVVLALQVATAAPAIAHDVQRTFSGGPDAAGYLVENGLAGEDTLIGVYPSFIAASVLAPMPPRTFYFLETHEYGSYVRWTKEEARAFQVPWDQHVRDFEQEIARTPHERVVLVTTFSMEGLFPEYKLLASWESIAPGDAVYLYERVSPE